jgi:TatD DNase family protein
VVDTHAHLGLCGPDAPELVAAAAGAGVSRILTVGLGEDSNPGAVELAERHPEVLACVGRHPNGADGFDRRAAEAIAQLCERRRVVAVGETGLDRYRDSADPDAQRRAFGAQLAIARDARLPVVIHLRDREGYSEVAEEAFATLEREAGEAGVVLHCFSLGPRWAERAAERGWYCSFAGNLTYPSADLVREAARAVPAELLLVETDSPYLAPQPVRGKPNQPANVVATAERLAELRDLTYSELERLVEANAARVFGW